VVVVVVVVDATTEDLAAYYREPEDSKRKVRVLLRVRQKPTEYAESRHFREVKNALALWNGYGRDSTGSRRSGGNISRGYHGPDAMRTNWQWDNQLLSMFDITKE